MLKKIIICAAMLTTANQFAMQTTIADSVNKIKDTAKQTASQFLTPNAQSALILGGGILAAGYLTMRAIKHFYVDEIIDEVMIGSHLMMTHKKIKRNSDYYHLVYRYISGYSDYVIELTNTTNNHLYAMLCYGLPTDSHSQSAFIHMLRVAEFHRQKGYGSTLLNFALKKIAATQCQKVRLIAQPHILREGESAEEMLPKLIKFYERHQAKVINAVSKKALMEIDLKNHPLVPQNIDS